MWPQKPPPACSWPPAPACPGAPTSMGHHLIFCSHFAELHKERTWHGGVGSLGFVFCLFICLI